MNKPEPISHETAYGKVTLNNANQLVTADGYPCIRGDEIKINGKFMTLHVRYDNKPELATQIRDWKVAWEQYEIEQAAEFAQNVPGLRELEASQEAAYNDQARYDAEFDQMMETGEGISPKPIDESLPKQAAELAKQYPRAAMYLQAQGYTYASNVHKYSAGKQAMSLIAAGGSLEDAKEILSNWLPESAWSN